MLRQVRGRGKPGSAQDVECEGDGSKGADQEQCPVDGPALLLGKPIPEQKPEAGTKDRTSASDQNQFRNLRFGHGNTSLASSANRGIVLGRVGEATGALTMDHIGL